MTKDEIIETIKDNLKIEVRLSKEHKSPGFGEYIKCEVSLFCDNELISKEYDTLDILDIING